MPDNVIVSSVATDTAGSVYVAGTYVGNPDFDMGPGTAIVTGRSAEGFIAKYSNAGSFQWVVRVNGEVEQYLTAMTVDDAGNVLACGYFSGATSFGSGLSVSGHSSTGGYDGFILKIDTVGRGQWVKTFTGQYGPTFRSIATDADGAAIVVGKLQDSTVDFDPGAGSAPITAIGSASVVVKLDAAGQYVWSASFQNGEASDVATDGTGNIFITGLYGYTVDFDPSSAVADMTSVGACIYVVSLAPNLTYRWARSLPYADNTGSYFDASVTTDRGGGVYVGAVFNGTRDFDPSDATAPRTSTGPWDAYVTKLSGEGLYRWTTTLGGSERETITDIVSTPHAGLYVGGWFDKSLNLTLPTGPTSLSSAGSADAFYAVLSPDGTPAHLRRYGGAVGDEASGVAIGSTGDVLLCGQFNDALSTTPVEFGPATGNAALVGGDRPAFILSLKNRPATDIVLSSSSIAENQPSGTTVGTLSTTDPDAGDTFIYALVAGTGDADNAAFSIDGSTLKTAAAFNFEAKSSYSIRVKTTDQGGLSTEKVFTITVTNANETPTDIGLSATSIAENQPSGTTVGTLSTTDPDAGDTFTYALVVGTGDADNAAFSIDGSTLKTSAVFNFKTKSSYSIRVKTTDQGGLSTEKVLTISVTNVNEAPADLVLSAASIAENQPSGTTVGTLSTTDPDAGNTFTYALVAGTGDADNAAFSIDGSTLKTAAAFNFDAKSSYSIRVKTADQGGLSTEKAFTITVTNANETPTDIGLSATSIAEKQPSGTTVGTLSTTDPDAGNTFTYALVAGTGDADNAAFSIDGSTLKTAAAFNFETKSSYSIRVKTTDQGGHSTEKVFTISVTNANESPTGLVLSATSVAENQPSGTTVGTLSTTDPDAGDTFIYALVAGTGDADNNAFSIDGNTLKTAAVFNFEAKSSYSIRVKSTDQGGLSTEKVFSISVTDVNESPAGLALSSNSVAENQPSGTTFGTLSTTDPDAGNTFTYALVTGTGDADNASFSIDGSTLKTAAAFNFETKSSYSIRVKTTDQGGLSTEKVFTFSVTNVNEAPADLVLSAASIAENQPSGTTVGTLSTTDPDAGDTFIYALVTGTGDADNAVFSIDGSTLKTAAVFNFEAKSSYSVRVKTTDQGGLSTEKVFTISVTNVNEAPADLVLSAASIAENQPSGTTVGTLSTTDPDAGDTFTYALVAGTGDADNAAFSIDGSTLKTAAVFDFETKSNYSIHVKTTDQGGHSTEKVFTISVTNANEPATALTLLNTLTTLAENAATTTRIRVADISITDDAIGSNLLSITGRHATAFEIIAGSLWVRAGADLNFEAVSVVTCELTVTDATAAPLGLLSRPFSIALLDIKEPATAPVVSLPTALPTTEDTSSPLVFPSAPFTDADSPGWTPMRVTVAVPDGVLKATSAAGITVTGGRLTKTFAGTLTALNAFFTLAPSRIAFSPPTNASADRSVRVTISERYGTKSYTSTATSVITVAPVNDSPQLRLPTSFTFKEDTVGNLLWPKSAAPITDVDSPALTVTLAVARGEVTAMEMPGVTVGGTAAARTLSGPIKVLNTYLTTAGRVRYRPAQDDVAPVGLTATVSDGLASSAALSTLKVIPVNDAPTIAADAVVPGSGVGNVVIISHAALLEASKTKDIDSPSVPFVAQWVSSGSLDRWDGKRWVPLTFVSAAGPRTINSGQTVRWTPPPGARGRVPAFRIAATDGLLLSATVCDVSVDIE